MTLNNNFSFDEYLACRDYELQLHIDKGDVYIYINQFLKYVPINIARIINKIKNLYPSYDNISNVVKLATFSEVYKDDLIPLEECPTLEITILNKSILFIQNDLSNKFHSMKKNKNTKKPKAIKPPSPYLRALLFLASIK